MKERPTFEPGEIVLARFPFTDLTGAKVRPVVVLRDLAEVTGGDDVIICPISSRLGGPDRTSVQITRDSVEFLSTNLKAASEIHAAKLFTSHRRLIARRLGMLAEATLSRLRELVRSLLLHEAEGP